jgi:hypothetical protein
MEDKIRSLLYEGTKLNPLFNPVEGVEDIPSPLVIDLTRDVTNLTRIYHPNTDAVRELLVKAEAVVCDTEALAGIARKFTKALVVVAPFGFCSRPDIDNEFTIGLLNHGPERAASGLRLAGRGGGGL